MTFDAKPLCEPIRKAVNSQLDEVPSLEHQARENLRGRLQTWECLPSPAPYANRLGQKFLAMERGAKLHS